MKIVRSHLFSSLFALLTSSLSLSAYASVEVPVGTATYGFAYDLTYHARIDSGSLNLLPSTGPFSLEQMVNRANPALGLLDDLPINQLRLTGLSNSHSFVADGGRADHFYSLGGGMQYRISESFNALVSFELDREKALDPAYTGQRWRGLAGEVQTAVISYQSSSLTLALGRERVFWGPQPVNLALSSTAEPLDLFNLKFHKGRLDFSFLFARLDQSRPDSLDYIRFPENSFNENRYLAGHRLDLRLRDNLRLGLFELTVYGGEGRSPELYYLNPLQFFHANQLNDQIDDNTALGFDLSYIPTKSYFLYGQLLIDDFQIDNQAQGDQEPNEIGLMVGVIKTGQVGSWKPDIKAEYTRITNRTYHQRQPRNRFLHRNRLLGHPLGPDADSIALSLRWWPSKRQAITLETALRRHGEGSIYNSWDEPWELITGDYAEPFPTGVAETARFVRVGWKGYCPIDGYLARHLFFEVDLTHGKYENFNNTQGVSRSLTWVGFSVSWLGGSVIDLND